MSMTTTDTAHSSTDYVPADFSDLFKNYYQYVTRLVQRFGIEEQNSEDVAMTILTKFYEKDVLADFSPSFTTHHGGVTRPAVFSTFLSGFVFSYVRHYRTRQVLHTQREGKSIYTPVDMPGNLCWIDLNTPSVSTDYDEMITEDLIRSITAHLTALPPRVRERINLATVFSRVAEQINQSGKYDVPALSKEFGVSQNAVRNAIVCLRTEVAEVLADI